MPFITPEDVQGTQAQVFPDSFQKPQDPVSPAYYDNKAVTTGIATAPQGLDAQSLETHIDNTRNQIELGNENKINSQIANDQQTQDKSTQQEVLKDAVINNDAVTFKDVANTYANPKPPTPTQIQTAPYVKAATNLQTYAANESPVQAKAQEQLTPEALADVNDLHAKMGMIQSELDKAEKAVKDQTIFDNFKDYSGLLFLPLESEYATSGNFPVETTTPKFLTGSHIQNERDALLNMPLDKFTEVGLPTFVANAKKNAGYFDNNAVAYRAALRNLVDYNDNQASIDNVLSEVDHFTLGITGGRLLRSLSRTLVTSGARVGSAELNASKLLHGSVNDPAVNGGVNLTRGPDGVYREVRTDVIPISDTPQQQISPLTKYITQTDAITDSQHSGFVPNFELTGTNAPTAVADAMDKQEAVANRVNQLQRSPFLSPSQQAKAIGRTVSDMTERLTPQGLSVADFHMVSQPNSATTQAGVKIGKTDGTGWTTEENARAAMERSGYGVNDFTYAQGIDNLHYPLLKTTVSGNGLTAPADIDKLTGGIPGMWRKYLQNTDTTDLPSLERVKTQGAFNQVALETKVYAPLLRPVSELGQASQNIMGKVVNFNMDTPRDLNIDEFRAEWKRVGGKEPTDKEITAYYSLRQANNVNFALDNRRVFEDFANNGYKDYEFPHIDQTDEDGFPAKVRARKIDNLPARGSTRVYDATEGEMHRVDDLRATDIANLKEEGYHLFEAHDLQLSGGPVTHVLAKSPDYIQHEISPFQVRYKPGTIGPRIYKKGFYLKQVRTHSFEDGVQYRGKDLTLFADRTKTSLQNYANRWNKALDAWSKFKQDKLTTPEVERVLGKYTQFETVQDFQKALDDGMFTEHPMQVVKDGERPQFGGPSVGGELSEPQGLTDFTIHQHQSGQLVTSPRGPRLTTPDGELMPVLDVQSAVSKASSNAIKHTAFDVYKKQATEKWFATAQKLQVLKEPHSGATSNIMDKDPYIKGIDAGVKSKLETMRMSILRVLGQPAKSQQVYNSTMEHIGDWIAGNDKIPNKDAIAPKVYDLASSNPLSALRGFVFHKTLSAFNPAQLIIQPSTAIAAWTAHPIYGTKAWMGLPVIRLALANGNANVLDYLAKNVASRALHGMGEKEFKLYISELKNSSAADSATGIAMRGQDIDTAINQWKATLGAKDILKASAFFFNEGNKINQLIGHGIAWQKAKDIYGLANITSPQARNYIISETNKLGVSMKNTSAAYWQKGLLSLPTTFNGYTERLTSWMLPAFLGGDSRFTKAQRIRLVAGQVLFFGKYGLFGAGLIGSVANYAGISKDEAQKWEGGIMDRLASELFGTPVSYSQRTAVSENIVQLIQNLQNEDFAAIMGGPTYTGSSDFVKQLRSVVTLVTTNALENEPIHTMDRLDSVMAMAKDVFSNNISSLSNYSKAMALYNYGKFISNSGKTVVTKPELIHDHLAALAVMLSLPLQDAVKANDLYQTKEDLVTTENSLVNHISQFKQDFVNKLSVGDYIGAQQASDRVHIMEMILPENTQQKRNIIKRVNKGVNKQLIKVEEKQVQKLQGREDSTIEINSTEEGQ